MTQACRRARVPLSVIHAEALYRPRPPMYYDDEGYLCEDSKISESTAHDDVLSYFREVTPSLVYEQPDAIVQRNLLMLFEEGNPRAMVEPDVMVSFGVGRHPRDSYKLWVEGKPPDLALDGLSERTWRRDLVVRPALYRDLGVREYWQLDPMGRTPNPICGHRLSRGDYTPIRPNGSGAYRSAVLNAEFTYDREEMRIVDLRTGKHIPPLHELLQQIDKAHEVRAETRQAHDDALQARDDVLREWDSQRKAYEARIAGLEAKLRARAACTN